MKKPALFLILFSLVFTACPPEPTPDEPTPNIPGNQTPVAGDYTFGNFSQTAGNATAVTITAKSGKSPGAVNNIKYNGINTIPQTIGTYTVTFSVAAASGWNAAVGLSAGSLTVYSNQTPDGFTISQTGMTITITDYTGTSKGVTIPAQINGKSVTAIGNRAFYNKQLTSVSIPDSVTTIGDRAFAENHQLTSVTIGNSVTTIGEFAFYANQLTSVTIPNSVTTIGDNAFGNNQLTSITIGAGVTIAGGSFPSGFFDVYNNGGRQAGTYTNTSSSVWTRQE